MYRNRMGYILLFIWKIGWFQCIRYRNAYLDCSGNICFIFMYYIMETVQLKFLKSSSASEEGRIYLQFVYGQTVRLVRTDYRIRQDEWDESAGDIAGPAEGRRAEKLRMIRERLKNDKYLLLQAMRELENTRNQYSAEDVIRHYQRHLVGEVSVFRYLESQVEWLRRQGRYRTSEAYLAALRSFMKFRRNEDLFFDMIDVELIGLYEMYLKDNHMSRNSISFYMRILRCVYNRAVREGLSVSKSPFRYVYTGIDKTAKRAVSLTDIRKIRKVDLSDDKYLELARDLFLFSFYTRGMSFVDMAYLRKKDLNKGFIVYCRKKTGQQLTVRWESQMQEIMDRHLSTGTQYLLDIIRREDGTERKQYLSAMALVNRKLKVVAERAEVRTPLTMYVARHSWASIAHERNIPISIISEGMGHDSEQTTQIYLSSIQTHLIDEANNQILMDI